MNIEELKQEAIELAIFKKLQVQKQRNIENYKRQWGEIPDEETLNEMGNWYD